MRETSFQAQAVPHQAHTQIEEYIVADAVTLTVDYHFFFFTPVPTYIPSFGNIFW